MSIKIGMLSPFLPEQDGIAQFTQNLVESLGDKGIRVVKIGRIRGSAEINIDFKSPHLRDMLKQIIKREDISIIHIQHNAAYFSKFDLNKNLINAMSLPVKKVVTLHEVHTKIQKPVDLLLMQIEKRLTECSDQVIAHTESHRDFIKTNYKNKCVTLSSLATRIHRKPITLHSKNILCFGMISKGKGLRYLIRAMPMLKDFNLTIAGKFTNAKIRNNIEKELNDAKGCSIETRFNWISDSDKNNLFRKAGIIVLPHVWAPYQSGILMDAVSWGIPIVSTNIGGIGETVERYKIGILAQPRSPISLCSSLAKAYGERSNITKNMRAYQMIVSSENVAEEHIRIYRRLVS